MTINRRTLLAGLSAAPAAALVSAPGVALAGSAGERQPVLHQYNLGEAKVTVFLDGHLPLGTQLFADYNEEAAQAALSKGLHRMTPEGLNIPVNGYLIEQAGRKILVDAGTSDLLGPNLGAMGDALLSAGTRPEDIDLVLLTHMHPDHSGGLSTADGQAVYPNAELAVSEVEWGFWHDDAIMASVPEGSQGFFLMARKTVAPYADRLRLFKGEVDLGAGLSSLPLPGHTPGHTGFMLDSGGEQLLFWGDVIHSVALQFAYPDWTIAFDTDPAMTAATRRKMFDRAVADNLLLTGAHIDFPGLGRVLKQDGAYAYQAAPWQFGL